MKTITTLRRLPIAKLRLLSQSVELSELPDILQEFHTALLDDSQQIAKEESKINADGLLEKVQRRLNQANITLTQTDLDKLNLITEIYYKCRLKEIVDGVHHYKTEESMMSSVQGYFLTTLYSVAQIQLQEKREQNASMAVISNKFKYKHPILADLLIGLLYAAIITSAVLAVTAIIALTGGGAAAAFLLAGAAVLVGMVKLSAIITGTAATLAVASAMVFAASCVAGAIIGSVAGLGKYLFTKKQHKHVAESASAPAEAVDAAAIQRSLQVPTTTPQPGLRQRHPAAGVPRQEDGEDVLIPLASSSSAPANSAKKNSGFGRAIRQWTAFFASATGNGVARHQSDSNSNKLKAH